MNNIKNIKNGFTLIELLAVIIILGILMIIAVPSVTSYISDTRKAAYIDTAKNIISGARNLVNEGELDMFNTNATYYIPISCINSENSNKSPYGEFDKAYVIVTFNGNGYNYYWVSRDETGQGVKQAKLSDKLVEDDIESDIEEGLIKPDSALEGKNEIKILDEKDCKTYIDGDEVPKYKCIIATTLNTKTCELTSGGCYASGYREGGPKGTKTITFGKKVDSTTLTPGFAYDCDVNGDGSYNSNTERFYYITTIEDKAVLFSSHNFEGSNGQQDVNIFSYNDFEDKLPTVEQWGNVDSTFEDKAGRLLTLNEIKTACNKTNVTVDGALDDCNFFLENTKYESNNSGRTAIWIKKEGSSLYRIQSNTRRITSVNNSSTSGVRPAIEISLDSIEPYISQ
jgi:prepilin-type N-terminal cleavage/methylation domain-containing protein